MYDRVGHPSWRESTVYGLATWKNGLAFKNIDFSRTGRPIIKIAELKSGVTNQTARTSGEYDSSVFVQAGDMLFSWSGNPDTSIDVFRWDREDGWLNQHIFKVTPQPGIDDEFLFFALRWLRPRFAEIARNKQTTGLGHVTIQDLKRMIVGVPTLSEQRQIVSTVSPLEHKIELNRKMNQTLEAIAQATFRDWFIDFGPVRRKQAGVTDPVVIMGGMMPDASRAAALAALFPDLLDQDGLPAGWCISTVGDAYRLTIGKTPPRNEFQHFTTDGQGEDWISIRDLGDCGVFVETTREGLTRESLSKFRVARIPECTVIVSFKLTVGRVAITSKPMYSNEAIAHLTDRGNSPSAWYTYCWMKHYDYSRLGSTSSIATAVNSKTIREMDLLIPDNLIVAAFDQFAGPHFERIRLLQEENRTLIKTLACLLPGLMSGSVRINDAEQLLSEIE